MTEARHYQRILDHLATHISRFFYRETRGANCEAGGEARFRGRRVNPRLRCFRCHPSAVRRVHLPSRLPPQGNNQPCSHLCTEGRGKGLFTPAPATAVPPHHSHGTFFRLLQTKMHRTETCDHHQSRAICQTRTPALSSPPQLGIQRCAVPAEKEPMGSVPADGPAGSKQQNLPSVVLTAERGKQRAWDWGSNQAGLRNQ